MGGLGRQGSPSRRHDGREAAGPQGLGEAHRGRVGDRAESPHSEPGTAAGGGSALVVRERHHRTMKGAGTMRDLVERLNQLCDGMPFQTSWYLKDLTIGAVADRL